jgi:hypothetical protein
MSSVSQAERDVFARALHAQMADMTLDQVVSIITNPYDELIEYMALREGKRACQKTSLLFNPHRLDCATAKDTRFGSVYRALQDRRFHSGLARASIFRATEMGTPRVGEVFYATLQIGVNGTQYVNEFPPHVARDMCAKYGVGSDSRVLDPCGGWGGRMIGVSVVADNYTCFEPATQTAQGLKKLDEFIRSVNPDFAADIVCEPYEDSVERVGFYDFALTSPPYYDTERYSDEETNSCNRYGSFDSWCAGFFLPMVDKTLRQLKSGRPFVINVGDRKYTLSKVLEKHCAERGYSMRRVRGGIVNNAGFGRDADGGEKFWELISNQETGRKVI